MYCLLFTYIYIYVLSFVYIHIRIVYFMFVYTFLEQSKLVDYKLVFYIYLVMNIVKQHFMAWPDQSCYITLLSLTIYPCELNCSMTSKPSFKRDPFVGFHITPSVYNR